MNNVLARLARVAEENHNNLRNSGQSSLPPSGGKPATSLFGSFNTAQPQQNASTTQAQTSSLNPNPTTQPAQTSNLFCKTTSQPPQTSNLFGNTTQPAQTSSLFGNTTSQSQQGGMFGPSQNQVGNNQQQQQGSTLFGGNQNTQPGVGLFGSQQNNQSTTGGLVGSTTAQQPQPQLQQANLFNSVGQIQAQQPQNTFFGGTNSQNKSSSLLFVLSHCVLHCARRRFLKSWLTNR